MERKSKEAVLVTKAQRRRKWRSGIVHTWIVPVFATILVGIVIGGMWLLLLRRQSTYQRRYTLPDIVTQDADSKETRTLQDDSIYVQNDAFDISYTYPSLWNLDTDTFALQKTENAIYRIQIRQENSALRFQIFGYFARYEDEVTSDELMVKLIGYFDGLGATLGEESNEIGYVAGYPAEAYAFQSVNNNGCLLTVVGNGWSLTSILLSPPEESQTALAAWTQFLSSLEVRE